MDPIEVFNAMLAAFNRGDWLEAASYFDPASLDEFKREHVTAALRERERPPVTAEQIMRGNPDLPRQVAEYYAAQSNRPEKSTERFNAQFPGIDSYEQLERLDPMDVYAAALQGRSIRFQVEAYLASTNVPAADAESALAEVTELAPIAIGEVRDGEELTYVLYHENFSDDPASTEAGAQRSEEDLVRNLAHLPPNVATLRKQLDGSWKLIATARFPGSSYGFFSEDDESGEEQ